MPSQSLIARVFSVFLIAFSIWLLVINGFDYFLRVRQMYVVSFSSYMSLLLLIGLIALVRLLLHSKISLFVALLISISVLIGHVHYVSAYSSTSIYPRIFMISKNWSIQGDTITIYGYGFGDRQHQGRVSVDSLVYTIAHWSNTKIVAEQPVPENYFTGVLSVCTHLNHCVRMDNFSVKDPKDVL